MENCMIEETRYCDSTADSRQEDEDAYIEEMWLNAERVDAAAANMAAEQSRAEKKAARKAKGKRRRL